ncbi:MAG: hypothetical protein HQM04_16310 [Magnetococcales bacterium]|nr:hypothetical protein [Magnetococcales bacterium]
MLHVARFIRNTPAKGLQAYFQGNGFHVSDIDWEEQEEKIGTPLLKVVDVLDDDRRAVLSVDAARIDEMADELGQETMWSVVKDQDAFGELENPYARATWMFLNDPEAFQRAEEIRYTDSHRLGRMWDGFVGPPMATVSMNSDHHRQFEARIRNLFRTGQVKVEVYYRTRAHMDDESHLVQVMVYREGLPDSFLEFQEGELARRNRRPVLEFALTYQSDDGVIEVISQGRESREEIARMFAETLLQTQIQTARVPLRRYDLSSLASPREFPTEPKDGIESVKVVMLQLQPLDHGPERITFETNRRTDQSIYERLWDWFETNNPLTGHFRIQVAKVSIQFHPEKGGRRGKILTIRLALPNGCNLKGTTDKERLICEKYLALWGLVKDL